MTDVCKILQSQGVPCGVELDDVLIYAEGRENSLRATHLAISIPERAGFKINYTKSVINPTQVINYLGYSLNAQSQCFQLQKSKLAKCQLILKGLSLLNSVSRKLMEQLLGFLNFIFTIVPLARSFIKIWYDQFKLHIADSSGVLFDRSPLAPLRDFIFSKSFIFPCFSGVPKHPLPCFVNATPLRVAGISSKGCFSRPLPSPTPIFEAELCAALAGIFYHLPFSNFIRSVGDNLGVLFVLKKGHAEILQAISFCKIEPKFIYNRHFYSICVTFVLKIIEQTVSPGRFFPFFLLFGISKFLPCFIFFARFLPCLSYHFSCFFLALIYL